MIPMGAPCPAGTGPQTCRRRRPCRRPSLALGSFQWDAGIEVSSPQGGVRTTSEPSISEITATKTLDGASTSSARCSFTAFEFTVNGASVEYDLAQNSVG